MKVTAPAADVLSVAEYRDTVLGKTLEYIKRPGPLSTVNVLLCTWGLSSSLSSEASALKHLKPRAQYKVIAMYTALSGSLLDIVRVSAQKAGQKMLLPVLSKFMATRLGQRGFAVVEGLGGVAAGAGLAILGGIDLQNAFEAGRRGQMGMTFLYFANGISETSVGAYALAQGVNLIFRLGWVFAEFNPIILGLTAAIFVLSIIIEVNGEPATLMWTRQCLWGSESNYADEREEAENFNKALEA